MEETNNVKFSFVVPYNNNYMVAERKKQKIITGSLVILCAIFFIVFTILSATSKNSLAVVTAIFGVMAALAVAYAMFCFCTIKPNVKNDNKSIVFVFYENSLLVYQEDSNAKTQKKLTFCLYRKAQNKQFVSKIVESNNKFEFKIYIGSYNFIPQYKKYVMPKDLVKENLAELKEFLKQNLGSDYLIKQ